MSTTNTNMASTSSNTIKPPIYYGTTKAQFELHMTRVKYFQTFKVARLLDISHPPAKPPTYLPQLPYYTEDESTDVDDEEEKKEIRMNNQKRQELYKLHLARYNAEKSQYDSLKREWDKYQSELGLARIRECFPEEVYCIYNTEESVYGLAECLKKHYQADKSGGADLLDWQTNFMSITLSQPNNINMIEQFIMDMMNYVKQYTNNMLQVKEDHQTHQQILLRNVIGVWQCNLPQLPSFSDFNNRAISPGADTNWTDATVFVKEALQIVINAKRSAKLQVVHDGNQSQSGPCVMAITLPKPLHAQGSRALMNTGNKNHYFCRYPKHQYNTSHNSPECFELNPELKTAFLNQKQQKQQYNNNNNNYKIKRLQRYQKGHGRNFKKEASRNTREPYVPSGKAANLPPCEMCHKKHTPANS